MRQLRVGAASQSVTQDAVIWGRDPGQGREEDGHIHVDRYVDRDR